MRVGMVSWMVFFSMGALADEIEISEKRGEQGEMNFTVRSGLLNPQSKFDIHRHCLEATGNLIKVEGAPCEMLVDYFSDGKVRQYTVKCQEESGFFKFERSKEYRQPRLIWTDLSDIEIGSIANAENEENCFTLRDRKSKKIVSGHRVADGAWKILPDTHHPFLSSFLLVASRMEKYSCARVITSDRRRNLIVLGAVALLTGGFYLRYLRRN